ncbi:MCP four helix bundle domain-containing protein [Pseudomonas sp.]|uniref:MCP four helix bundle domain-containing protein n=1 Tax=Pseudomonas sp. TaxID=306 RepID=UPI0040547426
MSLNNMNIAPRASLGFGLVALIVVLLGGFSLMQMAEMNKQSDQVKSKWLPSIISLGEVSQSILRLRTLTLRLLVNTDPAMTQDNLARVDELYNSSVKAQANYEKLITSTEEKAAYQRFKEGLN